VILWQSIAKSHDPQVCSFSSVAELRKKVAVALTNLRPELKSPFEVKVTFQHNGELTRHPPRTD
jgi:hypothetical protein